MRELSRLCNYCGSPIATLRCGQCFMMNVAEALHCSGCGAELGLMPVQHAAATGFACPRCQRQELDAFQSGDGILHDCSCCGGQFVPHAMLEILVKRHQSNPLFNELRLHRQNPLLDKLTYLPCPNCRELMLRRNFGRVSGIIVDVCAKHGTWFDIGELSRILAFIGKGGMRVGQATLDEEQRQLVTLHARHANLFTPSGSECNTPISFGEMRESVQAFMQWVREMMR